MNRIMTPSEPDWNEFKDRLEGPEGCNFRKDDAGEIWWDCGGHEDTIADFSKSTAILSSMDNIDVPASIEFFGEHGGYCDCEVLFNVEASCR